METPQEENENSETKKLDETKSTDSLEPCENDKDTQSNETENDEKLEIDENKENFADSSGTPNAPRVNSNKKRSLSSDDKSTPVKKVRNKPKPQIVENMKEYIDNSTIDKLTTTTLRHWLKERSLHCTTREKKADLIEKVRKHILDNNL